MKKLLSAIMLHAMLLPVAEAQNRLLNQRVQLKSCNISITANNFIATTFIEMEFYNSKDVEVEALEYFRLKEGQVISAFQLDLNGKYRDGSIEEKWKASNAYNSIVGKRVDPAVLQMVYANYYSINIYPLAPHSSRKVTMTIDQLMTEKDHRLQYELPLNFTSLTGSFSLAVRVAGTGVIPFSDEGLVAGQLFLPGADTASLYFKKENTRLDQHIHFSIPLLTNRPQVCISTQGGVNRFLARVNPGIEEFYFVKPASVCVFWDVSASAALRDISKELNFLQHYLRTNNITTLSLILFNQAIQRRMVMSTDDDNFGRLRNYLSTYRYAGATCFGNLDFSQTSSDAILVFSDGYNSFGESNPVSGTVQVNCITSRSYYDEPQLRSMVAETGGSITRLYDNPVDSAIKKIKLARNFLVNYHAINQRVRLNEKFPIALGNNILLSGTFENDDKLELLLGNSGTVNKTETLYLSAADSCSNYIFNKVQMLKSYDSLAKTGKWEDVVYFGLREGVVTKRTSFIVLEKIEDYIKYNIAPPRELEQQCAERNYVYRNEYKIKALKMSSQEEGMQFTVSKYNKYIQSWDKNEPQIDLAKPVENVAGITDVAAGEIVKNAQGQDNAFSFPSAATNTNTGTIKEVIVTGALNVSRSARSLSSSVQYVNSSPVNIMYGNDINDALAGKVAGLQIRSQSSAHLGAVSSISLRGGNSVPGAGNPVYVLDGTIIADISSIHINDIESVSVLSAPRAAALFGAEGANGAIVILSKKKRYWYRSPVWTSYKLENAEDADYVTAIEKTSTVDLWETYLQLKNQEQENAVFYYDMAECFFERGLKQQALDILFNGIETCRGNAAGLKAAAFILESWKYFTEAVKIYQDICRASTNDLSTKRDLALAYFQQGNHQAAVNTYYDIITSPRSDDDFKEDEKARVVAMNEMNALISMHKDSLDLVNINLNLVKQLPVDLRIVIESNNGSFDNFRVIDEDGNEYADPDKIVKERWSGRSWYPGYSNIHEYAVKKAKAGSFRIRVDSYNSFNYYDDKPVYLRLVVFRNFQRSNQTMEVEHIVMNGQYGNVEISQVKWK